jgi:hypothetical protein
VSPRPRGQSIRIRRFRPSFEPLEERALPSTFMVTNTNDHGAGSLRAAMLQVNRDAVNQVDVIDFNIAGAGVHTIKLQSELPILKHPVNVDGTSQPGYAGSPLIALDGSTIAGGGDGMVIDARAYANAFTGEIQGLQLTNFNDGIRVIDSSSSTAVNAQVLKNVVTLTSGGDGIQVLAGTGSMTAQINNNNVTVGKAGDAVVLATAGSSTSYTVSGNTIAANAGGDGIFTNGTGSSNTLTYSGNTVNTTGGGDAMAFYVSKSSPTTVSVLNDVLSTNNQAAGLILSGGSHFQAMVQGSTFSNDARGVRVNGNGTTAGIVDLGGGSLGSTGGNDFSGFKAATTTSYAIGLFNVASGYSITALDDLFSVTPTSVIADGHHDPAAHGSGSILV